jgi:hypothetical protein
MITIKQLKDKMEGDLNYFLPIQSDYVFNIGFEELNQLKLPNNTLGYAVTDNNIYGVFSMTAGQFEAIQDQDLATIQAGLVIYVLREQKEDVINILTAYQSQANAVPFDMDDYSIVPVFNAIRTGNIEPFQGESRIPINLNITYTIAKRGIISNSIEVSIDNIKQLVLEGSFSMTKSSEKAQYNGSNRVVSEGTAKTLIFNMTLINIDSVVLNKIKDEIFLDNSVKQVYSIKYNDGYINYTNNMLLIGGSVRLVAGAVATLILSFELAR